MFGFGNDKEVLEKKAARRNEELVAIMQQIKFYREKVDILAVSIIELQKKPAENEARIHDEANNLIGHSKRLKRYYDDMQVVLKNMEHVDKKLLRYKK